jgi:type II secretory pathway component PulF
MIMAKKNKLPVSIFELVWYPICALVILWGLTYVVLGLVTKYNNISALTEFNTNFTKQFGLSLYFWGLIIVVIGVVAGVVVMLIFAKTFDRATEREQRRSARLNALKKDDEKVVAEQPAEVVEPKAE